MRNMDGKKRNGVERFMKVKRNRDRKMKKGEHGCMKRKRNRDGKKGEDRCMKRKRNRDGKERRG